MCTEDVVLMFKNKRQKSTLILCALQFFLMLMDHNHISNVNTEKYFLGGAGGGSTGICAFDMDIRHKVH